MQSVIFSVSILNVRGFMHTTGSFCSRASSLYAACNLHLREVTCCGAYASAVSLALYANQIISSFISIYSLIIGEEEKK